MSKVVYEAEITPRVHRYRVEWNDDYTERWYTVGSAPDLKAAKRIADYWGTLAVHARVVDTEAE